jgi:hypothetical protein
LYSNLLQLNSTYFPELELGSEIQITKSFHRALVESKDFTIMFTTENNIRHTKYSIVIDIIIYFQFKK